MGSIGTEPLAAGLRLVPFADEYAAQVAAWASSERDAYLLAPRTPPPLIAAKVRDWGGPGRQQLALLTDDATQPLGYGELNRLRAGRAQYWLGHLIVDPRHRGRGLGRQLTRLLLRRAFGVYGARRIALVVFPENHAAVACYRAAGLREAGYETHYFPAYRRQARLLRMEAAAPGR